MENKKTKREEEKYGFKKRSRKSRQREAYIVEYNGRREKEERK